MVIIRPLLAAAALLAASFASASPLQGDRLEERVPFCESRNSIVVSLRNSPQATAFCSSFLSIGPPTTTKTVLRTVRTIFTRPTPVSTTRTTGTVTSTQAVATGFTDQVSIIQETPSSTQTSIVTEASVEVSVTVATETSTISEPSTIFETSVSTETSVITELTETSTTSFIATTTRTTLADDVLRRGAAQATPAALYDKRLLSSNVIRSSRDAISSACSCIVKRPVQRTRTTTRSVTFTSIRPPTSTRIIVTSVTTVLPQASTTVTRETLTTTTLPTAVSVTLTTVTTPTTTETQTTTTSPLTVTYPTTDLDQSVTTTLTTTTTTSTSVIQATQTANVAYADRCAAAGAAPDAALRFLTATDVSEAACGNVCQRDSRCKSWVWQAQGQYCQLFTANLFRAGFVAADDGAARGYDVSCTVPPSQVRPSPSCGVRGFDGPNPAPLLESVAVSSADPRLTCTDKCYQRAGCLSWSVTFSGPTSGQCSLYSGAVNSYLALEGFTGPLYYDRSCLQPSDVCLYRSNTIVAGTEKPSFTSLSTCAAACLAASPSVCTSFSYEGTLTEFTRICIFYTAKAVALGIQTRPASVSGRLFSDRSCSVPAAEQVTCGSGAYSVRPPDAFIDFGTLQACNDACNARATCQTFTYNIRHRQCALFDQPADASVIIYATLESQAYNRGCPTPSVQICDSRGDDPSANLETPGTVLSNVPSSLDCSLRCQAQATCLSSAFSARNQVCTLLTGTSSDSGYLSNEMYGTTRWNDKGCPTPPNNCGIKATSLPSNAESLRFERRVAAGLDSPGQCDSLCRNDYLCQAWSFNTAGSVTTCRTYSAAVAALPGLTFQPTGSFAYTDVSSCAALPNDVYDLSLYCGPPEGAKVGFSFSSSYTIPVNTATNLQSCAAFCQQDGNCQTYAGRVLPEGNQYLCLTWREKPIQGLITSGVNFANFYTKFSAFYDRTCVLPAP